MKKELPHVGFRERACAAGIETELAQVMYDVVRDAQEHDWISRLKIWAGDTEAMMHRALQEPVKMAEACELLFVTDGLMHDEGQKQVGISDQKRREIEGWIFKEISPLSELFESPLAPAFDKKKMACAIKTLQSAARHQTGAGAFCGQLLAACLGKVEIDLSEVARLDQENASAAVSVFEGLAFHCGETRNLIEGLHE